MKFSCYKDDLRDTLAVVGGAVAVKPQTPITSGIYLKAEGNKLELQANNFKTGIIAYIPVCTEIPGETVVSGKRFIDFVKNMPDDTISVNLDGNALRLESGGASVTLLTMTAADFPKVQRLDDAKQVVINAPALGNLIRKTSFSVSKDESRPVFTGCYFEVVGEELNVVATNTHRLAVDKDTLQRSCQEGLFIAPVDALKNILPRLNTKDTSEQVTIRFANNAVTFEIDNFFMTTRRIAGEFPTWQKIPDFAPTTTFTVDAEEFKAAVQFVAPMSKETENKKIFFDISGQNLEVSANAEEAGGAVKNVETTVTGEPLTICFDVDYILDFFRVSDAKKLIVDCKDKYSPIKFIDPDDPNFIYVATPIRY